MTGDSSDFREISYSSPLSPLLFLGLNRARFLPESVESV